MLQVTMSAEDRFLDLLDDIGCHGQPFKDDEYVVTTGFHSVGSDVIWELGPATHERDARKEFNRVLEAAIECQQYDRYHLINVTSDHVVTTEDVLEGWPPRGGKR